MLAKTSEGKIPLANANFRIGEVLLFSCERSNRILQGSSRLECLEDGNWSSPVPTECSKTGCCREQNVVLSALVSPGGGGLKEAQSSLNFYAYYYSGYYVTHRSCYAY